MVQKEKLVILNTIYQKKDASENHYIDALQKIGDLKTDYDKYMTTAPININRELQRLPEANYDLACALMTAMLREDHFCEGSFSRRLHNGQVQEVLKKMIDLLSE